MPTTYEPIQIQTLTTSQSTLTFTSIPQTYTDLILVAKAKGTDGTYRNLVVKPNNGSGTVYSSTYFGGDPNAPYTGRRINQTTGIQIGYATDTNDGNLTQMAITHFMNYSNTTTFKNTITRYGSASSQANAQVGLWQSTAAISSLVLSLTSGNLDSGSNFALYGIANGDIGALATGGIITYDSTYYYHTFTASDTFTPKQNLSNVNYLVVAGGGGAGGGQNGSSGGGGAGGLRSTVDASGRGASVESAFSATSGIAYTITIGAGAAGITGDSRGNSGNDSSIAGSGLTTITSTGGGGGGAVNSTQGATGGAGGGSYNNASGGSGTTNQGYDGGSGTVNSGGSGRYPSGGGGGAGAAGVNGTGTVAGSGGVGVAIPSMAIVTGTGIETYYAGGGGGGYGRETSGTAGTAGNGGLGGGASGTNNTTAGANGRANTGGGGGGCGQSGGAQGAGGGAGGSGIVIIRYPRT